jgi:CBS domain-containing protein
LPKEVEMRIEDVMNVEVWTVGSDTPLKEAAEILTLRHISGLPVVDAGGHVVGVLSEGDILFKETGGTERKGFLERLLTLPVPELDLKLAARTVGEAMSAPAVTIGPKSQVAEAANTMIDQGVNRLPVVDDAGKLIGIVTRADLVRAFVRSDAEIAREIREDVLRRTLWIVDETINVVVKNGEVRLSGEVGSKADAELIPAFVQRVPGVVSVLSKLRWQQEDGTASGRLARNKRVVA